jgi:hypothetical protein
MNLELKRAHGEVGEFTDGQLFIDGVFECQTLEDKERPVKVYGKTAIHIGRYQVIISRSKRFRKLMPLLVDVPNFSGVRIHSGNKAEDTEGCILVGLDSDWMDGWIGNSRVTYDKLYTKIENAINAGEEVWLTIT